MLRAVERSRIAASPQEREAIYRFRYSVYVEELGRKLGVGDHNRRWVHDPEDDAPYTTLLYTGCPDEMTATLRMRCWAPGEVPDNDRRLFSMDLFPGIDELSVCELGRLMIKRDARNRLLLVSLCRDAYELAAQRGVDLAFANCAPRLVSLYRKLGFRPYAGSPIPTPDGIEVPLVMVPSDQAHFERVGCFLAQLVPQYYGAGRRDPVPVERYERLLGEESLPYVTDPLTVWDRLQHHFEAGGIAGLWQTVSPETARKLGAAGSILTIPRGELLTAQGLSQREMFIVVQGLFEALDGDRLLGVIGEGELVGEMAFFGTTGRRSASVRAVVDGQVLMLTPGFLDRLRTSDPAFAVEVLLYVARVLADRAISRGR